MCDITNAILADRSAISPEIGISTWKTVKYYLIGMDFVKCIFELNNIEFVSEMYPSYYNY